MSRSGYSEGCDFLELYRANVDKAVKGKRGQKFLREMATAMDEMPLKRLINYELINKKGEVCAIGVICKSRGLDVSKIDAGNPERVGKLVGIAKAMAAEIEYENDEGIGSSTETPEQRWVRMRKWVSESIIPTN